jgi:hypothetical protein
MFRGSFFRICFILVTDSVLGVKNDDLVLPDGRLEIRGATLVDLISIAYSAPADKVMENPAGLMPITSMWWNRVVSGNTTAARNSSKPQATRWIPNIGY